MTKKEFMQQYVLNRALAVEENDAISTTLIYAYKAENEYNAIEELCENNQENDLK